MKQAVAIGLAVISGGAAGTFIGAALLTGDVAFVGGSILSAVVMVVAILLAGDRSIPR